MFRKMKIINEQCNGKRSDGHLGKTVLSQESISNPSEGNDCQLSKCTGTTQEQTFLSFSLAICCDFSIVALESLPLAGSPQETLDLRHLWGAAPWPCSPPSKASCLQNLPMSCSWWKQALGSYWVRGHAWDPLFLPSPPNRHQTQGSLAWGWHTSTTPCFIWNSAFLLCPVQPWYHLLMMKGEYRHS